MHARITQATNAWWALARADVPARRRTGAEALWHAVQGAVARRVRTGGWYMARAAEAEARMREAMDGGDAEMDARVAGARAACRVGSRGEGSLIDAVGAAGAVCARTIGLTPHRNQLATALALADGAVVELATGEGKTLAISLAACVLGWRGRGCHVLTANDYLAERDARDMGPVYGRAGVTVGVIVSGTGRAERRAAYAADVTYSTAREAAADFLRDRMDRAGPSTVAGVVAAEMAGARVDETERVQRGLHAAIIDEADALLIDDAGTPLVLASAPEDGDGQSGAAAVARADEIAQRLERGRDYVVEAHPAGVHLTERGRRAVAEDGEDAGSEWVSLRRREELVSLSLHAREILRRDEHYVVLDGRVCIIDPHTGRMVPDRSWRAGLHQAVEAKEGVPLTTVKHTVGRTPFQRFFTRYRHLCGTTGTAQEVAQELWQTYATPVVVMPSHRPCVRRESIAPVAETVEELVERATQAVREAHERGQPVLVGTRSVEMSERVSRSLAAKGIGHEVLNAVRHAEEARIVARGGERGAVTIATNMAGRGTDIRLGEGVAESGGLMVIAVETQASARLERQLLGRGARQGDPGVGMVMGSLGDEVVARRGGIVAGVLGAMGWRRGAVRWAQQRSERIERAMRGRTARDEDRARESLELAGAE